MPHADLLGLMRAYISAGKVRVTRESLVWLGYLRFSREGEFGILVL